MGTDPHSYDTKITHIIIEELKRNDKTMCGMAAGNWIMDAKFVEQCGIEKKLLEPVQYEHKATDIDNITTGDTILQTVFHEQHPVFEIYNQIRRLED